MKNPRCDVQKTKPKNLPLLQQQQYNDRKWAENQFSLQFMHSTNLSWHIISHFEQ